MDHLIQTVLTSSPQQVTPVITKYSLPTSSIHSLMPCAFMYQRTKDPHKEPWSQLSLIILHPTFTMGDFLTFHCLTMSLRVMAHQSFGQPDNTSDKENLWPCNSTGRFSEVLRFARRLSVHICCLNMNVEPAILLYSSIIVFHSLNAHCADNCFINVSENDRNVQTHQLDLFTL